MTIITKISLALAIVTSFAGIAEAAEFNHQDVSYYDLPIGDGPHDVAPAADGTVWYTGQSAAVLGRLEPNTGKIERIELGEGSAPHGVIVGRDSAAWVTDGGLNAILRVDPATRQVKRWPLPPGARAANLNTAAFDGKGRLWFTGQSGILGRLDPQSGAMNLWDAPRGPGPYGITATPDGQIWYVSLAGNYLGRPNLETGEVTVIDPPNRTSGTRRVWSDSKGRLWVSEWNAGILSAYDPRQKSWLAWPLPGENPRPYAVYVDEHDKVWLSDFSANAILRFDPTTEKFEHFPSTRMHANVRQMAGRRGEVWGAESGTDRLVVIRFDTNRQ